MSGAQRVHDPEFLTERAKLHGLGNLCSYENNIDGSSWVMLKPCVL